MKWSKGSWQFQVRLLPVSVGMIQKLNEKERLVLQGEFGSVTIDIMIKSIVCLKANPSASSTAERERP